MKFSNNAFGWIPSSMGMSIPTHYQIMLKKTRKSSIKDNAFKLYNSNCTSTTTMEISEASSTIKKDYRWKCENIPGYREKFAAAAAEQYRKRKAENPTLWNEKKSAYWKNRYNENPEFRNKVLASLRNRRKKQKLERNNTNVQHDNTNLQHAT